MMELYFGLKAVMICLSILIVVVAFLWFWWASRRRNKMWEEYCDRQRREELKEQAHQPIVSPTPTNHGGYGQQRAFREGDVQHRPRPTPAARPYTPPPAPRPSSSSTSADGLVTGLVTGVGVGVGLGLMAAAVYDEDDRDRLSDPEPYSGGCDRDDSPSDSGSYDSGSSDDSSYE